MKKLLLFMFLLGTIALFSCEDDAAEEVFMDVEISKGGDFDTQKSGSGDFDTEMG